MCDYKVVWDVEGTMSNLALYHCKDELVRIHNKFAEVSEGLYKAWNAEYDSLNKGDHSDYEPWIASKMTEWAKINVRSSFMDVRVNEECQWVGHPKGYPEGVEIKFHLEKR